MTTSQATLCEVTYDHNGDLQYLKNEFDEYYTPYRIRSASTSATSRHYRERLNAASQLSYLYNKYLLESLGACDLFPIPSCDIREVNRPTTAQRRLTSGYAASRSKRLSSPPNNRTTSSPRLSLPQGGDASSRDSRTLRSPRSPVSFIPSSMLPLVGGKKDGVLYEEGGFPESGEDEDDVPLKWMDSLNMWIPEDQYSKTRPYLSFVNTAPMVEKYYSSLKESPESRLHRRPCERFEAHMCNFHQSELQTNRRQAGYKDPAQAQMALQRRNAERKKSDDIFKAQKRQRRAQSTPLYSSETTRRSKVRFQAPRSETASPVENRTSPEPESLVTDTVPSSKYHVPGDGQIKTEGVVSSKKHFSLDSSTTKGAKEAWTKLGSAQESDSPLQPSPNNKVQLSHIQTKPPKEFERTSNIVKHELSSTAKKQTEESHPRIPVIYDQRLSGKVPSTNEPEDASKKKRHGKSKNVPPDSPPDSAKDARLTLSKENMKKNNKKGHKKKESKEKVKKSVEKDSDSENQVTTVELPLTPKPLALIVNREDYREETSSLSSQDEETKKKMKTRIIVKKQKPVKPREVRATHSPPPAPESPTVEIHKTDSWIYGDDDFSIEKEEKEEPEIPVFEQPPLPSTSDLPTLERKESAQKIKPKKSAIAFTPVAVLEAKKKWGPRQVDSTYNDELRRQIQAEERRKKQSFMYDKLKLRKKKSHQDNGLEDVPNFDDYNFLTKYCIFQKGNLELYRHAFDAVDEQKKGWLSSEDCMIALRAANSKLSEHEEGYLFRVMEMTGYNISKGADFKLFSVLSALSLKISSLDKWMKNIIGQIDFKMLDMKLYRCKTLWECNVDPYINKIPLDQLCVDLRAGGVSLKHEKEVRHQLGHLQALDLLDFLTYIPLFIMIHESVVDNPLDDSREK